MCIKCDLTDLGFELSLHLSGVLLLEDGRGTSLVLPWVVWEFSCCISAMEMWLFFNKLFKF